MKTSSDKTMTQNRRLNLLRWAAIAILTGVLVMPVATEVVNAGCRPFSLLSLKPSILTRAQVRFNNGAANVCDPQSPFGPGYNADFIFDLNPGHSMDCNMDPCDSSGPDGYGWLGGAGSGLGFDGCTGITVLSNGAVVSWTIDFKVKFHEFQAETKKKWGKIIFSNMGNYYHLEVFPDGSSPTGWRCQNVSNFPGQWLDVTAMMQEYPNP